jgi:ketosteroid isomerase-like protein
MSEHPNAAVLRRAYEAFARQDVATLGELFADDVVWHVPGRSALSGVFRGQAEVFGYFHNLREMSGGTFKAEARDFTASDKHVVSLEHLTGARDGKTLDLELALVVHVRAGQIAEARDFFSDPNAWDEFWA